jgi:hypothetical protein
VDLRDRLSRIHKRINHFDEQAMDYIRVHANLLRTVLMLGLCVWGIWQNHVSVAVGIIVTGAISYFVGFILSLTAGFSWVVVSAMTEPTIGSIAAALMINFVGFSCVAWLGYQHKETKEQKQTRETPGSQSKTHSDQVVPWDVTNDVRTSLAAIRFLLFPIHEEKRTNELEVASRELSRLEQVFKEIEEKANK